MRINWISWKYKPAKGRFDNKGSAVWGNYYVKNLIDLRISLPYIGPVFFTIPSSSKDIQVPECDSKSQIPTQKGYNCSFLKLQLEIHQT